MRRAFCLMSIIAVIVVPTGATASAPPTRVGDQEYRLPSPSSQPLVITEFEIPTAGSEPFEIATGPDGRVWFTEYIGNKIGAIQP
jgi:streptogramin lyase